MNPYFKIDQIHLQQDAALQAFQDVHLPLSYPQSSISSLTHLKQNVALFDAKAYSLLALEGPEAELFLQGMVTNDISKLEIGDYQNSFICQQKGKILFHVGIFRYDMDAYWVLTDCWEGVPVGNYLNQYHIREEFRMRMLNPDQVRMDLYGDHAESTLRTLGYSGSWHWEFQEHPIVSIESLVGQTAHWINILPTAVAIEWMAACQNAGVELVGQEMLNHLYAAEGVPQMKVDYSDKNFPQETGLLSHISYTKGCYVGQEPNARMHHRGHPNWQLVRIEVPNRIQLKHESPLYVDGTEVGYVTSLENPAEKSSYYGIAWVKYAESQKQSALAASADTDASIQQFPISRS